MVSRTLKLGHFHLTKLNQLDILRSINPAGKNRLSEWSDFAESFYVRQT